MVFWFLHTVISAPMIPHEHVCNCNRTQPLALPFDPMPLVAQGSILEPSCVSSPGSSEDVQRPHGCWRRCETKTCTNSDDDPNEVDNVDEQQDVRAGGGSAGVCNENNQSRLRGIKCAGLLCWFYT